MAVPRTIASRVQRREVKVSLRTSDPLAAKVRSRLLSNAFDVMFKGLETMPEVTTETIHERIKGYFQGCLNRSLEHTQLLPSDPAVDLEQEVAYLRTSVEQMRRQLAAQSFNPGVVEDATRLLHQTPTGTPASNPETLQYACSSVLRAKIENSRILAAQLEGRYDDVAPRDPLFTRMAATGLPPIPGEAVPQAAKPLTLRDVGDLYCAFKGKHDWVAKTATDTRRVLTLAEHAIGAGKPMRSLDAEDVKAVRDLMAVLPPNYAKYKKNAKLDLKAVIAKHTKGPAISVKTQDKYFGLFKAFLHWAADENYIDKMPGANVKVAGVAKLTARDKRLSYSAAQLDAIFGSPLFTGHRTDTMRHRPGKLLIRDGKFWVPLIALYSGMRMGEIVQLLTADVKQEDGIRYFDVTKTEGDGKRVKTQSSFRRVPIHRALVDLGFLAFVAKAKPKGRLFPDIAPGADGYFSHNISKWWGRYARQVGFFEDRTAFHSFRHTFIDGLRNAKVPEAIGRAIVGHSDKSVHASYGSGPSLAVMKEEIDRVSFPVDLLMLKTKSFA